MVLVSELSVEEVVMVKIVDQVGENLLGLNEVKLLYLEECLN
jgi:hypothetical protein